MSSACAESQVVTVHIAKPLATVAAFLAEPLNMNLWASGLGHSLREENGEWLADGPEGPVRIRFSPANAFGIADHWVEVAAGVEVYVPLRAIAHADAHVEETDVQLTLLRLPGMSDTKFAEDADWIRRDLATLKALLEKESLEKP
ncbi:MAG: hypothetical protein ACRERR_15055 [Moraxellaceae bacterium]